MKDLFTVRSSRDLLVLVLQSSQLTAIAAWDDTGVTVRCAALSELFTDHALHRLFVDVRRQRPEIESARHEPLLRPPTHQNGCVVD